MKHLTPDGWKPCKASVRQCPYQQSEFRAKTEAKVGGAYYAASIPERQIRSFIKDFRTIEPMWSEYEDRKAKRDRGKEFHATIISPREARELKKQGITIDLPNLKLKPIGLGKVAQDNDVAYFVVLESKEADSYRASLGLSKHDFHVTLGFKQKDIHGVPKDKTALI